MRRFAIVLVAGLLACSGGTRAPEGDSGIEGLVLIGPTCPVVHEGQDCDDKPFAGEFRVVDRSDGNVMTTVRSAGDGRFRVALAPGSYRLEPVAPPGGLPFGKPVDVVVRPGTYERVTVSFDSGIR